jgi:hypothetical protein
MVISAAKKTAGNEAKIPPKLPPVFFVMSEELATAPHPKRKRMTKPLIESPCKLIRLLPLCSHVFVFGFIFQTYGNHFGFYRPIYYFYAIHAYML